MKCISCGSQNIAPSTLMYECNDCGYTWNDECTGEVKVEESPKES